MRRARQFHYGGGHDQQAHAGGRRAKYEGNKSGPTTATPFAPGEAVDALLAGDPAPVAPDDAIEVARGVANKADGWVDITNFDIIDSVLFNSVADGIRERKDMPQIDEDRMEQFKGVLEEQGISFSQEEVAPTSLNPTQNQLDLRKAGGIAGAVLDGEFRASNTPWVSNDDYILDGHHRWAGFTILEVGGQMDSMGITRVDMPIDDLLRVADEFNAAEGIEGKDITVQFAALLSELGYHHGRKRRRRFRATG